MTERDMGGPAFPVEGHLYGDHLGGGLHHGITTWDYYAAAALTGLAVAGTKTDSPAKDAEYAALDAAKYADEMLAERRKRMEESK